MTMQAKVYTRTNDNGVHYARIVVPKSLRAFVTKNALWRSLSTKDEKEAHEAGSVVAASTQIVLQEVSDAYAEAAVVTVETELLGAKFDLAQALDKISQEDLEIVAQSLREKLGVKNDDVNKPSGGSKADAKKSASKNAADKQVDKNTVDAAEPKKLEQDSLSLSDSDVAHYIEKRKHGVYRFRFWVPRKLQQLFGQREVRETLKTENETEAIDRARPILAAVLRQLQQIPTPA